MDRNALLRDWDVIKARGYGTNFLAGKIPLTLYDQGRSFCNVYHGMGVGVKVTSRPFVLSREVVARAGTRLLAFVVVARTIGDADDAVTLCQRLGVGGEHGYGVLLDGNTSLVYDIARSTAWFANVARATTTQKKPSVNLRLKLSRRHRWTAWFVAKKTLRLGDPLFAAYGKGSTHHAAIAADVARRMQREPECNAHKRTRCNQLAAARKRRW